MNLKKVGEFRKKFFHGLVFNQKRKNSDKSDVMWSFQHLPHKPSPWETEVRIKYWPIIRELREEDLIKHFNQKPILGAKSIMGSLGCVGTFEGNKAKWFCIDCDTESGVNELREKYLPILDKYGIEYIWEFSGNEDEEKAHVWFMCDCVDISLLRSFTNHILKEANVNDKELELFPTRKGDNVIRLPGGVHLKTNKVNPVKWKGTVSSSADFVMDAFIECKPITEEFIRANLPDIKIRKATSKLPKHRKFYYNSRGLPLPENDLPPMMRKIVSNCQAINGVIEGCKTNKLMQDQQGLGHTAGLWLWSIANYCDARSTHKVQKGTEGETWIKNFTEKYRLTPYDSHNWDRDRANIINDPERYFTSCRKWEEAFGMCEGCPFRNRPGFTNPKQFWYGIPVVKSFVKEMNLVSAEETRLETFAQVRKRIWSCLESNTFKDILIASPQGSGKCLGINTPILMYDGTIKMVQDVQVGDLLMGPDSKPRKVKELCRGREKMYRVVPVKGEPWVCNESHILSLKYSGDDYHMKTGDIINIPIKEFTKLSASFKNGLKQWRTAVTFKETKTKLLLDPYVLGLWLGDGHQNVMSITTIDNEVIYALKRYAIDYNARISIKSKKGTEAKTITLMKNISGREDETGLPFNRSVFTEALKSHNLLNNKHIPTEYKKSSIQTRLNLLAGLLDSDGHLSGKNSYDWINKDKALAEDFAFLCRSLGFATYLSSCTKFCVYKNEVREGKYYRVNISGDTYKIPCKVERKKAAIRLQKKDPLVTGFTLEELPEDDYYGFEIFGPDRLFLLGDFTVTHNSYTVSDLTVELAKKGFRVLISVPTGALAMEHKERIEKGLEGTSIKPFILMSFRNLFDKLNPGFDCPNEGEITHLYDLGVSSGVWKNGFCKKCPHLNECPYPNQYKQVKEDAPQIVIMQHAYFSCRETIYSIMENTYDVMFIDEAFISDCHKTVKPLEAEIEALETFSAEFPWVEKLHTWLKVGGYAKEKETKFSVKPSEAQLETIKCKFDELQLPWRIPDYVRYFSLNTYYDIVQGLHVFYPLPTYPYVKLRVFTDATPPIEYLKKVLDNNDIEIYGSEDVLDYRKLNKNNSVVQVLDSSMSKTSLKGEQDESGEYTYERFTEILEYIGDLARNEYKGQKILITTYADGKRDQFKTVAETFLKTNYPELDIGREPPSQICISHMMIGTNKFSDYLIQFLVAGVYLNATMFKHEVFKLKSIGNFWNRMNDRPIDPNPYPYDIGDNASIARNTEPVKRILPVNNRAAIFEYKDFMYSYPADPDYDIIERYVIAKSQQAIRLRFNDSRQRKVIIFGNYFLPSFLITDSVLEDDLLGYIRTGNTTTEY